MHDLQQTPDHHDVLQEVDHLVLIRKMMMKKDGGREREPGKRERRLCGAKSKNKQQAAAKLEHDGDQPTEGSQGQSRLAYLGRYRSICGELAQPTHDEGQTYERSAQQREVFCAVHSEYPRFERMVSDSRFADQESDAFTRLGVIGSARMRRPVA